MGIVIMVLDTRVKREAELLDKSGNPKHILRVSWEHLVEPPVCMIFNLHLLESLLHVQRKVGDLEMAKFSVSIVAAAFESCGLVLVAMATK